MSRIEETIAKFELRRICSVKGVEGQKMDEETIQKFVSGDPSGNGKYLEWMLYMAGGGKERLDKSTAQWEKGDHGEPPVRETLREQFVKDCLTGYKDDKGLFVQPVSQEEAEAKWKESEPRLRRQHIYGDEDYAITGFGFYRTWQGHNNLYDQIVQTVRRFNKHQQALRADGKSTDLSLASYPNLRDLMEALQDLTLVELKADVQADEVYRDDLLVIMAPYNIGASLKFGIPKWCTACESMVKTALAGGGPNRWKEYAKDAALYYCKFLKPNIGSHPVGAIAIQVLHTDKGSDKGGMKHAKYWNSDDVAHGASETLTEIRHKMGSTYADSFKRGIDAVSTHYKTYPTSRVVLEAIVKA